VGLGVTLVQVLRVIDQQNAVGAYAAGQLYRALVSPPPGKNLSSYLRQILAPVFGGKLILRARA